jgi:hypothetical protein
VPGSSDRAVGHARFPLLPLLLLLVVAVAPATQVRGWRWRLPLLLLLAPIADDAAAPARADGPAPASMPARWWWWLSSLVARVRERWKAIGLQREKQFFLVACRVLRSRRRKERRRVGTVAGVCRV